MTAAGEDRAAAAREAAARGRGAIRAYQDLVVGSRSWWRFVQHEALAGWGALLPGAVGLAFRAMLWRGLFAATGRGVVWGRGITLRHALKMRIGDGVTVDDACQLDAQGCGVGEFEIGEGVLISRGCIISGKDGPLQIGPRVNIGAGCVLYASSRLEIGADTMLAALCYVGGGRYTARGRIDIPIAAQPEPRRGVVIEEDCWLGAGCAVIDGARIGRGSVVAAGAVVTGTVEPYSVVAGVPARLVRTRRPAVEAKETHE
jgi:acetyltransferase-like isoleucine patch superfamily enzyme